MAVVLKPQVLYPKAAIPGLGAKGRPFEIESQETLQWEHIFSQEAYIL